jgi:Na+/proline symporter
MVPILGSLMSQELVSRVVASRSAKVAHNSALRAAVIYFLVGSIPVLVGLLGTQYMPNLQDSETLMPLLAKNHLNYFYYIVFVGALVSAILSTVDTTLLASSAIASHNLIYPLMENRLSEKQKVRIARGATLVAGLCAYAIAFSSDSITELVETASSLGGPSILIITIIALWVKRGNSKNAIFAMSMSVLTWMGSHFLFEIEFPIMLTVVVCGGSYFLSLPFTQEQKAVNQVELG